MPGKGKLVALECIDEARLEQVTLRLYRWLCERAIPCEHTTEPTFGPVGAQMILHRSGRLQIDPLSLALVDLADRMDHLGRADGVLTWLDAGRHVLCRHYLLASFVRHLPHVDLDWLLRINARCPPPDLTLYLAPETSTHAQVEAYAQVIDAVRALGWPLVVDDGHGSTDELLARCRAHVAGLLGLEV